MQHQVQTEETTCTAHLININQCKVSTFQYKENKGCGDLDENGPHRLICLISWPQLVKQLRKD